MAYYVYILQSLSDGRYYIGSTENVDARLAYHNSGRQRSTHSRVPFRLVLYETFPEKSMALKRERQIKSWKGGSAFKRLLEGI